MNNNFSRRTNLILGSFKILGLVVVGIVSALSLGAWASYAGEDGGSDKLPVYLDRNAHPTAEDSCSPGNLWVGTGIPNTGFQRKRNLDRGVELAIKGQLRQGPDIRSTFVDTDGLVHIEVPAGAQPGNSSRAAWNFTYSYDVGLDTGNPNLDAYDGELWIDLDPSNKTKYLKLTLDTGGTIQPNPCLEKDYNGYRWMSGNNVIIGDDEGTQKVTQNSQNYAFYSAAIDTDKDTPGVQPYAYGPAQFDVVMILKDKGKGDGGDGGDKKTVLHVVFDVVNASTQTPWFATFGYVLLHALAGNTADNSLHANGQFEKHKNAWKKAMEAIKKL